METDKRLTFMDFTYGEIEITEYVETHSIFSGNSTKKKKTRRQETKDELLDRIHETISNIDHINTIFVPVEIPFNKWYKFIETFRVWYYV